VKSKQKFCNLKSDMLINLLRILLIVGLLLNLSGYGLAEDLQRHVYREAKTGILLPSNLGPLRYQGVVEYKDYNNPELGVSIRYAMLDKSPARADIFLYDLGLKNLGTGILKPVVGLHFDALNDDVFDMEKTGRYMSVTRTSMSSTALIIPSGKLPALTAQFRFKQPAGPDVIYEGFQLSELILTTYKDSFLKIRFSYPEEEKDKYKKVFTQFLSDLGKCLK